MTNEHEIAAGLKLAISMLEVDRSAYKPGEPDADHVIYRGYTTAITSIGLAAQEIAVLKADAERMRWLLDGNGYFMEHEMLCGHGPCTEEGKSAARAIIDAAMKNGV